MILTTLFLAATLLTSTPAPDARSAAAEPTPSSDLDGSVSWKAPGIFVDGAAFEVQLEISIPSEGAQLPAWALGPAGFSVAGKALGDRSAKGKIPLAGGTQLSLSFDLGPSLFLRELSSRFELELDLLDATGKLEVSHMQAAKEDLDFMKMDAKDLAQYRVLMRTNQGDMVMEFWPQDAPGHVHNFLDLCYTGFYEGVIFHRVIPGFMIQGGDPTGTGGGDGPRSLKAEFNDRKHERGVLSMARSNDPNSASCQFFVMHARAGHLDGKYSAFGKLVSGIEVVDRMIATRGPGDRPTTPQIIEETIVLLAP